MVAQEKLFLRPFRATFPKQPIGFKQIFLRTRDDLRYSPRFYLPQQDWRPLPGATVRSDVLSPPGDLCPNEMFVRDTFLKKICLKVYGCLGKVVYFAILRNFL